MLQRFAWQGRASFVLTLGAISMILSGSAGAADTEADFY